MKIFIFSIVVILVFSSFGAVALKTNKIDFKDDVDTVESLNNDDFTHTVLVEYASATWCPPCEYAHGALKELFAEGEYPFYYISLVTDENKNANSRAKDYNVYYIPDVFFDGGYKVNVGAGSLNQAKYTYSSSIFSSVKREVSDIDIDLNIVKAGDAKIYIEAEVNNNEQNQYDGHIRVYVTEIVSSMGWKDKGGELYSYAFLDYAFDEDITININDTWKKSTIWNGKNHYDGYGHNFGSIQHENIMVIAGVFNSEWHQGYAVPDEEEYPFDAYYVDEVAGSLVADNNNPNKPTLTGKSSGSIDLSYNYTAITDDFDEDQISYKFDWGDGQYSGWSEYVSSGTEITMSHSWNREGSYDVRVKAKDVYGAESEWSDPLSVSMPKSKSKTTISQLVRFLENYPIIYEILQHILNL